MVLESLNIPTTDVLTTNTSPIDFSSSDTTINIPVIDVPAIDIPPIEFSTADTNINIPTIDIPTIDIPSIDFSSLDTNINIPTIDIPTIDIPSIEIFAIDSSTVGAFNGDISSLDIPKMTTDTSSGDTPSFVSFPNRVTGEGMTLSGGTINFSFTPEGGRTVFTGSGGDTIHGSDNNDIIAGGLGNDQLTGHGGADGFLFGTPTEGIDTITDFNASEDKILISASGFGAGLTPPPAGIESIALPFEQLSMGSSATTDSDRFIYDNNSGALFFDADGIGSQGQSQLAQLSPGLAFTNENIHIVG